MSYIEQWRRNHDTIAVRWLPKLRKLQVKVGDVMQEYMIGVDHLPIVAAALSSAAFENPFTWVWEERYDASM